MKKSVKTGILIGAILIIAGAVLFGAGLLCGGGVSRLVNNGSFHFPGVHFTLQEEPFRFNIVSDGHYREIDNPYREDGKYQVDAAGISRVELQWLAGTVQVAATDGNQVTFTETAPSGLTQETALRWSVENGVLYIQHCPKDKMSAAVQKDLTLHLPRTLAQQLSKFSFQSEEANLQVSALSMETFSFDSKSGALSADAIEAKQVLLSNVSGQTAYSGSCQRLEVSSVSGDVTIASSDSGASLQADTTSGAVSLSGSCRCVEIETVSGDISADGLTADEISAHTNSGCITLSGTFGEVDTESVSGDVILHDGVCPRELSADSTSGNVQLYLPADSGFALEYETASGNLQCAFDVRMGDEEYQCGSGAAEFSIETTSGDLWISPEK